MRCRGYGAESDMIHGPHPQEAPSPVGEPGKERYFCCCALSAARLVGVGEGTLYPDRVEGGVGQGRLPGTMVPTLKEVVKSI